MRRTKSFIFRNIFISVAISVFIGAVISFSSYQVISDILKNDISKEANNIVHTWGTELDIAEVKEAMKEDYDSPAQQKLISFFDQISKNNNKVAQAYIFSTKIVDGNNTPLIGAPSHLVEVLKEEGVKVGDPFPQPDRIIAAINEMMETKTTVASEIYNDDIGTWISELYPLTDNNGEIFAYFGVDVSAELFHTSQVKLTKMALFVLLPGLILIILFQIFYTRKSFKPLNELLRGLNEVGNGNLQVNLKVEKDDELGQIVALFNKVIHNMQQMIFKIKETSAEINHASAILHQSAEQTGKNSVQVAHDVQVMNDGMNSQEESISNTVLAIEEVATAIQTIAGNSQDVSTSSIEMDEITREGSQSIKRLIEQMDSINQSFADITSAITQLKGRSQSINDFLTIIGSIADQTNLLALNAAIEAARAGEAGKGFSVVAEEVKKLAEESRRSTDMIANIIKEIQTETDNAVSFIELGNKEIAQGISIGKDTDEIFGQIQTYTNQVSQNISEVSASSQQISASTEEITATSQQLENISAKNATISGSLNLKIQEQEGSVKNIYHASDNLHQLSDELEKLVENFKVE
ncbi:methyl-accepting chemotaxis protein [Cytobacillus depressus]|uniref:Methyl-accepting chemotaxis protein n=1 Tax=Cytobacillus depressus TaxID=1602942 RepID=A0A6L3V455_9BACI|nr:HAMP domain-containing methyl-accepting chemotaxis protein [Cytobacillus depressus]KAB2332155.1 methyl-accepting chemotaxis protein [Cytobacillus depressus]